MGLLKIDLGEIAELGTNVAMHGTLAAVDRDVDDLFELIVGIAILIYEMVPDFA
ncbi:MULTISPECIES: hypothetical protein [Sphingomonas]|uniref:Uncharacterized protein n=1 Tax=Sphingomonas kyeonggiensis TaxID=1268553 RepID=A0A7W7NRD2_9SPHN|nr:MULTISPECIES: hypothetical protein [Sphingomonas]MBB4837661.1 hypothetical protein [Sphingomonas kyeonggiensis]WHU01819.1 hypothetical protein O3305_16700 [Sphingomonas sp. NIBR02145]